MFYSEYVLAKKGALGKIWLAAHWEKKLTRNQMSKSNIVEACQSIIKPVAPLALRTSAHLLIGVVRIHDGKQKSLMHDCSDALVKIKLAFRPGNVDLPNDRITANVGSITMAETLDNNFDDEFPGVGHDTLVDETQLNIGTMEEITMVETDYHSADIVAPQMDGFGEEMESGLQIEQGRNGDVEQSFMPTDLTIDETMNDTTMGGNSTVDLPNEIPMIDDDFQQPPLMADDFGEKNDAEQTLDTSTMSKAIDESKLVSAEDLQLEEPSRIEMVNVSDIQPLDLSADARQPTIKLARRKRKLVVDQKAVEISSSDIRRGLEPHGPDDITKQPFRKHREVFVFDRSSHSMRGVRARLHDRSAEALFRRPLSGGFGGRLADLYQKSLQFNRDDIPKVDDLPDYGTQPAHEDASRNAVQETTHVEPIEVGRNMDPAEMSAIQNPDDTTLPLDDTNEPVPAPNDTFPFDEQPLNDVSQIGMESRTEDTSLFDASLNDTSNAIDPVLDTDLQITSEEFEQQDHLTKRTARMMTNLRTGFEASDSLSFKSMTHKKTKRVAAACLFELLVLKTKDYIHIEQPAPYDDITVTPTTLLTADA